jgi:hypothetical protein
MQTCAYACVNQSYMLAVAMVKPFCAVHEHLKRHKKSWFSSLSGL